jgi:hypothetical protein
VAADRAGVEAVEVEEAGSNLRRCHSFVGSCSEIRSPSVEARA